MQQEELRNICDKLIQQTQDDKELNRLQIICEILSIENCFVHLELNTAINLLLQLGFSLEDAKKIYLDLSSFHTLYVTDMECMFCDCISLEKYRMIVEKKTKEKQDQYLKEVEQNIEKKLSKW